MVGLKTEKKSFAQAEIARQPQIRIGCHRTLAEDNFIDPARRDFDGIGEAVLAEVHRLEEFLQHKSVYLPLTGGGFAGS